MTSSQSSSEHFGQHLKSVGGSEAEVSGSARFGSRPELGPERIEAEGADFGAIYFPSGGGIAPGTGALECSYDSALGWHR